MTFSLLSTANANLLIHYISLFLAYVVVVTLTHFFKAWIALMLGDSTAAEHGFLSLDPRNHIEPVGAFCLLMLGFGWGRAVPINGLNIHGRFRMARIIFAEFSDIFAYIGLGTIAMSILILFFNTQGTCLTCLPTSYSSLSLAFQLILAHILQLSVMLSACQLFINCFYLFIEHYYMKRYEITASTEIFILLVPVVLLFIFIKPLALFMMYVIALLSTGITQLIALF